VCAQPSRPTWRYALTATVLTSNHQAFSRHPG